MPSAWQEHYSNAGRSVLDFPKLQVTLVSEGSFRRAPADGTVPFLSKVNPTLAERTMDIHGNPEDIHGSPCSFVPHGDPEDIHGSPWSSGALWTPKEFGSGSEPNPGSSRVKTEHELTIF